MKKTGMLLRGVTAIVAILPGFVLAGPSNEWSEAWGFRATTTMNNRLIQADLIEKKDEGYYERLGTNTYYVEYHVNNYNQHGTFVEGGINVGEGGSASIATDASITSTTSIGAYNNNDNSVNIRGDDNDVDISNIANSRGDQDGSISYKAGDDISIIGATTTESSEGAH
jgi:hypothetical protein